MSTSGSFGNFFFTKPKPQFLREGLSENGGLGWPPWGYGHRDPGEYFSRVLCQAPNGPRISSPLSEAEYQGETGELGTSLPVARRFSSVRTTCGLVTPFTQHGARRFLGADFR